MGGNEMFRFAHPFYFLLLIPALAAAWFIFRRRVSRGVLFSTTGRIPAGVTSWRVLAGALLGFLYVAGLVLVTAALARPQTVLSKSQRKADVISIYMVTDISGSMEALDMSDFAGNTILKERTRLDAVKDAFAAFVNKRPDDLVGLVTFGGFASTRSPLTPDHEALIHLLKGIEVPRPSQDGSGQVVDQEELMTAIGDGLATACARMEKADTKSKIIVLLSDGESNTGAVKPDEAAKVAKKMGIRVYTIGVGGSGQTLIRGRDMFGRAAVVPAMVSMDEGQLKRIAEAAGGLYFNVRNPRGMEKALDEINKLEKTSVERDVYNQYNELFGRFLWPGLGLLALATTLNMAVTRRIV
jgi:Ca-activated chloride channel homolog